MTKKKDEVIEFEDDVVEITDEPNKPETASKDTEDLNDFYPDDRNLGPEQQHTEGSGLYHVDMPADSFIGIDAETKTPVYNITVDSQQRPATENETLPVNLDALHRQAYYDQPTKEEAQKLAQQLADHAKSLVEDVTAATEANNILQHVIGQRDATIADLRKELQECRGAGKQLAIV
jgi:hypothetical protein